MINIKGLDKAEVFVSLYECAKQQGYGLMHEKKKITVEQAREMLKNNQYFDYVNGAVMKVDLSSDEEFSEHLYDRDNGVGAAQRAVDKVKQKPIEIDTSKGNTNEYSVEELKTYKEILTNIPTDTIPVDDINLSSIPEDTNTIKK